MKDVRRFAPIVLALSLACDPGSVGPAASPTLPPAWSLREASGLRIAAPAAWLGPEVLPARDATGGPRAWIVFRDPTGAEALTFMTWRDTTARALASAQFQSERPQGEGPHDVTLVEGSLTRTAVAITGFAHWSDATGAGTYECRHLFVQVDAALVVDVIACGAHVRGSSTPAPDLRRTQERVALWLVSAGGQ